MRTLKACKYDIICYTASIKPYADVVLDFIEGDEVFFSQRLYRNNCIKTKIGSDCGWVKDLRIFHRVSLKDIIIVDNSLLSFALHVDNGIPILPFYDNKNDYELEILAEYLKTLSIADDIRNENRKFMKFYQDTSSASEDDNKLVLTARSYNLETNIVINTEESYNSDFDSIFNDLDMNDKTDPDQSIRTIKSNYSNFQISFDNKHK